MNIRRSQFSDMNDIMNDKKGHNIVKDSFAHKPDGLLVSIFFFNIKIIYSTRITKQGHSLLLIPSKLQSQRNIVQ